ncbi:ABC transporter ATP-binding protein [Amaricoccus sp.]|uniref:ATP-binding cassette domain-containing protein n=1 Tax=Amaricoccus sp. TaxID=1872485 RepID=UPI001B70916A|nr:ABC transporter ATP-binding protein [Amaricoccus sp.]MBP7242339.1 ABC transporter ATP-binding protein [Amaricoccus sp.]
MTLVALRGVSVRYPGAGRAALAGVTLDVHAGERLAVIGESGSGKSTLARAVAGLLPEGTAVAGEIGWQDGPPRPGRDVGYVFQEPGASLDPLLSVGAHLVEALRANLSLRRREARERAAALLARVRIPEPDRALAAYPHQFSGGQAQRIAIALAVAGGPKLLIADEATSALDVLVQAEIVALLRELCQAAGMTLLFVTHDIALAGTLADRIAVLHDAHLVEVGAAREVLASPREDYTRALLAAQIDLATPPLVRSA